MRGGGVCRIILAVSVWVFAYGCDGTPLCETEAFVAFEQTSITVDVDPNTPGVQTDIHIRTSLLPGDVVTLEVLSVDGTLLETRTALVDSDGSATLYAVSVPAPRVVLRATGRGVCGVGNDQIAVDVSAGDACTVSFDPAAEANAFYAPRGVLSTLTDPDPVTPGYQTTIVATTQPGWSVELFEIADGENSLGVFIADDTGRTSLPLTVVDGQLGFRAVCRGADQLIASPTNVVVVDTTAPDCALIAPDPSQPITPLLDGDSDLSNGLQLTFIARAFGGDVAGEPVALAITGPDQFAITAPPSAVSASGLSMASVTLAPASPPASYDVRLTMRDHAGNTCVSEVGYQVVYSEPAQPADLSRHQSR